MIPPQRETRSPSLVSTMSAGWVSSSGAATSAATKDRTGVGTGLVSQDISSARFFARSSWHSYKGELLKGLWYRETPYFYRWKYDTLQFTHPQAVWAVLEARHQNGHLDHPCQPPLPPGSSQGARFLPTKHGTVAPSNPKWKSLLGKKEAYHPTSFFEGWVARMTQVCLIIFFNVL